MSKGSPTRLLSGKSIVTKQQTRTVCETGGMPQTNQSYVPPWRADPTLRRAFALIEAQRPRRSRKRSERVNRFASSC
jgi:hypothetical protein